MDLKEYPSNTSSLQNLRFAPNRTRLSALLAFGPIDSVADPAILVVGLGVVTVVVLVVVVVR